MCGDRDLPSRLQVLLLSLGTSVKQSQPAPVALGFGSSSGSEAPGLAGRLLLDVNQVTFSFLVVCQCWHCAPHLKGEVVCGPASLSLLPLSFRELLAVASVSFLSVSGWGDRGSPSEGCRACKQRGPSSLPYNHSQLTATGRLNLEVLVTCQ